MITRRLSLGKKKGLSIERVENLNDDGYVLKVSFEVFDSDGSLLNTFGTLGEAWEFVNDYGPDSSFPLSPR